MTETVKNACGMIGVIIILFLAGKFGARIGNYIINKYYIENLQSLIVLLTCTTMFFALWLPYNYFIQLIDKKLKEK